MKEPHRAFIVAMLVDMSGFRAFAETAEPEILFGTLQQYHRLVGETVDAGGGQVIDYAGDGVLVAFNDRVALDAPERSAISTAIALRKSFGELALRWAREGTHLGVKMGMDAGHATLGRIGYEGHYAYGAVGRVVVNAALISRRAREGQILISERLASSVGDLATRPVGDVTDPHLTRPLRIVEVLDIGVPA